MAFTSSAQRDASRSLYNADGALQQYVSNRAQFGTSNLRFVEGTDNLTYNGVTYTLRLARLSRAITVNTADSVRATDTWSVIATPPVGQGRGVGGLLRVSRSVNKYRISVSAGATSGGDFKVGGNATISNGSEGQVGCASGDTSAYSLQVTSGSKVTVSGNPTIDGKVDTSHVVKDSLMSTVLGRGITLDSIAKNANIKFGPRFGQPDWPNNVRPSQSYSLTTSDSVYNWGCPSADMAGSNVTCTTAAANRFVVVAIDATNLGNQGGLTRAVTLNGDYGQGILIILNGSLNIQGNFVFRGIVLVEKDLSIGGGNANFSGKIEGTIVAFGSQSNVEDNVNGTATVRYNTCSITDAQNALNRGRIDDAPQVLGNSTFAWFEVVR